MLFHGNLEMPEGLWRQQRQACRNAELTDELRERCEQSPYADRRIHVEIAVSRDRAEFLVRDEGPGFDISIVPTPEDPESLHGEHGQGLVLMENFMDEVTFNKTGNEVRMTAKPLPSSICMTGSPV